MIMVWNMFFIGWTNIMGIQILIPHNKHKQFMVSTTIPAFFSIACNLVLIPYLGYIGAAIYFCIDRKRCMVHSIVLCTRYHEGIDYFATYD